MRATALSLCLLLGTAVPTAKALSPSLRPVRFGGKPYINLQTWGKTWGFGIHPSRKALRLQSKWTRIEFKAENRLVRFNGTKLWLSFPVLAHRDRLYATKLDLEKTLEPLLKPPLLPSNKGVRLVVLDPGHGGKDPGSVVGKEAEKKHTLLLAFELKKILLQRGFRVLMTRTRDETVSLTKRTEIARLAKADLYVSLHYNSLGRRTSAVKGVEVYVMTPSGAPSTNSRSNGGTARVYPGNRHDAWNVLLGYFLQRNLVSQLKAEDRGLRRARFVVLRNARMPAALVEGGFMSAPDEARKIYTASYRRKIAAAIADGITAYRKRLENR